MSFLTSVNSLYYPGDNCPLPNVVMVEPTDSCTLKCVMCDVQQQKTEDFHFLSPDQLEFILDQFPKAKELIFCGIGEPLLNRDIFSMINIAKKRKIPFINLITNGELLGMENSEKLINSGLNQLHISMPAITESAFSKIRNNPKVSLKQLSENINNISKRREIEQKKIKIIVNIVMMKYNLSELTDAVLFCRDLDVDGICFVQLTTIFGKNEGINLPRNRISETFKMIKEIGKKSGLDVTFLTGNDYGRCYQLWDFIMIHADGNISPCNGIMPTENINLGNIFKDDIKEIWLSDRYKELRRKVREFRLENCNFCESGYLIEGKNWRWWKNFYIRPLRNLIAKQLKRTNGV